MHVESTNTCGQWATQHFLQIASVSWTNSLAYPELLELTFKEEEALQIYRMFPDLVKVCIGWPVCSHI